jgi:hypothetical protein
LVWRDASRRRALENPPAARLSCALRHSPVFAVVVCFHPLSLRVWAQFGHSVVSGSVEKPARVGLNPSPSFERCQRVCKSQCGAFLGSASGRNTKRVAGGIVPFTVFPAHHPRPADAFAFRNLGG